ncbi:hypothetical protein BDR03DRAFT_809516, partial [Suillus americanus]
EELLIDFCKIISEHSGANLAEAMWNTLELYGLKDRIMGVVCDNATNNDTLLESLEKRCADEEIHSSCKKAWICCLPHIVHLS